MSYGGLFELPHEKAERLRPDPCPELWRDDAWCEHVNLVVTRFYVGDMRYRSSEHHEDDLRDRGITHIVDCRTEHERSDDAVDEPKWCETLLAPTEDDMQPKTVQYFERIARWADELDGKATLLVHCQSGVNRGPSALFAILRLCDSQSSARSVLASIRIARPIAAAAYWRDAEDAVLESASTCSPPLNDSNRGAFLVLYADGLTEVSPLRARRRARPHQAHVSPGQTPPRRPP